MQIAIAVSGLWLIVWSVGFAQEGAGRVGAVWLEQIGLVQVGLEHELVLRRKNQIGLVWIELGLRREG